jgi:parallel beta-helix repeat protein
MLCESFTTPGIVVGADGIDINLNGLALKGPEAVFFDSSTPTGIDNTGGHDDVTIRNGILSHWGAAVEMRDASFSFIHDVNMSPGYGGVLISGGESHTIRHADMTGSRFGYGLHAQDTVGLVVADSSGFRWDIRGSQSRVVRNQISQGGQFTVCLSVSGNGNRIADNHVDGCPGGSLVVGGGANNEVVGNEAFGAWTYIETDVQDGIRIGPFTSGTLVENNFVHDNDDDGIDVRGAGTRLKDNRAHDNGDFGIDAVAGVTDGGGNTASGNGNPLQCRNVFCS